MLDLNKFLDSPFTYVDCGSRGDQGNPLLNSFSKHLYVGFDPGQTEVTGGNSSSIFFPVAAGRRSENIQFYRTKNPNCSSLYLPNKEFLDQFMEVGPFFDLVETQNLPVVALDEYLPQNRITDMDFIELDTQGSELDILDGARTFLGSSVIGLRVEVEFLPMYKGQPLFADVDTYLRGYGFMLFDLERYHLRRKSCPPGTDSREQIVWGQALYLRDFLSFSDNLVGTKQRLCKLAMISSYYGFHGYVLDIINYLLKDTDLLTTLEKEDLENSSARYVSALANNPVTGWMKSLDKSLLRKAFHRWGNVFSRLYETYRFVTSRQKYFWKD